MQVRAGQLQDASAKEFEQLRVRSRELRLRTSDLQAREQQLRESRFQTPAGPERAAADRQWLSVRHDMTAATLELESVNERISEIRAQRDQAAREQAAREQAAIVTVTPARASEPAAVEANWLAGAGTLMLILFAPLAIVLVYRLLTRGPVREPVGFEASPRFQRLEQTIDSIAMEVEAIAEAQRFTTRILAERHPEPAPRVQATPAQGTDAIAQ